MPDEGAWYILLINKARVGDHWLLKRLPEDREQYQIGFRHADIPVRTRSYRNAASFDAEAKATKFLRLCGYVPPGYLAHVMRIVPPRAIRRPGKRRVKTPYGTVTLLEGQLCLFGETEEAKA